MDKGVNKPRSKRRDELEDEEEEAQNVLLLRSNDGREQAVELVDALLERGRVGRNRQLLARKLSAGFALDHDTVKGSVERRKSELVRCCRSTRQMEGEKQRGTYSKSIILSVKEASFSKQNEYSPTVLAVRMKSP